MWEMVRSLRDSGVTIILTTHYIEEAEEMADRIGVISKGEIHPGRRQEPLLMRKLGASSSRCICRHRSQQIPAQLAEPAAGAVGGQARSSSIRSILKPTPPASPACCGNSASTASTSRTCTRSESSLEEIFVSLMHQR